MIKKIIEFIKVFWFVLVLSVTVVVVIITDYLTPDLIIRIDSKTGCEYLTTKHGGLTPRMNQSGMYQICTTPVRKVN